MGILVCRTCGVQLEGQGRGYKYCEAHRLSRAEAKARDLRHLRTRRREARSLAKCIYCGAEFLAMRSDAKACSDKCKRLANNAKARKFEAANRGLCVDCGTEVTRHSQRCHACSQKPRIASITGEKNYAWKGGRTKDRYGYILVLARPEQRKGHRYRFEHTLVWEAAYGLIPEGWVIHHINGIKDDNRLENLEAMPRKKHNHRHDEHDKRILELEAENRALRQQLDGDVHPQISQKSQREGPLVVFWCGVGSPDGHQGGEGCAGPQSSGG